MSTRLAIIDGSSLFYRAWWVAPGDTINLARMMSRKTLRDIRATHALIVFDSFAGDLFRKSIDPTYKGQRRTKTKQEVHLQRRFRSEIELTTVSVKGRDGDDVMYSLARQATVPTIIVTTDKDLLQCVNENVSVYCPMKKAWYRTDEDVKRRKGIGVRARHVAPLLALVGDDVDNVKGLKGIGPVKARSIIESGDIENHPLVVHRRAAFKHALRLTRLHKVAVELPPLKELKL